MLMRFFVLAVLGSVLMALSGCAGQRYIHASIELDGKSILKDEFGVTDRFSPQKAWSRLEEATFTATEDFPKDVEQKNPLVLRGKIKVRMTHVKSTFAEVDVQELKLVPHPDQENTWKLAEGEVERTRKLVK